MRRLMVIFISVICLINPVLTCYAASESLSALAETANTMNRAYTYSTSEKDNYNFAQINFYGTTIQVVRREYRSTERPDEISIKQNNYTVLEQLVEWGESVVEGSYYGYNYNWDVSGLADGEYTLSIVSRLTTRGSVSGKPMVYIYPYTLTSVSFVKQGETCYIPLKDTISRRYNNSLLQQLQNGNAPNDFEVLKKYYEKVENSQTLNEIEAKAKELTAGLDSDFEKCMAIYEWIVNNIAYDYDFPRVNTDEWLASYPQDEPRMDSPLHAFETGYAMCYGYAKLTTLMLGYAGVESVYIKGLSETDISTLLGNTVDMDAWDHAWNAVKISGSWYFIDTCKDATSGYYRTVKNDAATGYFKFNKLVYYIHVFPSVERISNTHIAIRYGAEGYGNIVSG